MAPRIQIGTVLRVKVEFTKGTAPPRLARIALSRNALHRVINPRREHTATFHDVPEGPTEVTASLGGRLVGRKQVVVPGSGELDVTLRIGGDKARDDHPFHGGFKVVDEHSGEPFRGRKYRITSAAGVLAEGETDKHGETVWVGTDEQVELHLELLDDDDDDHDDDGDEMDGDDDGDDGDDAADADADTDDADDLR